MLNSPFKDSTKKNGAIKSNHYDKGMFLIRGKLYKQATTELSTAARENPKEIIPKLIASFNELNQQLEDEAVQAIGHVLLEVKEKDFEFLNTLGNSARRLKNYQKANDLYRKSLRINKSFMPAFYNLAASLAKVDKYDMDIKSAVDQFYGNKEYILPNYINDPEIVDKIIDHINQEKDKHDDYIQSLLVEKERKLIIGEMEEVKELIHKIESEERISREPTYELVCKKLRQAIKTNWKHHSIEESKAILQENLFNLGLYALSHKDAKLASECFYKLKNEKCTIENLELLLALTQDLEGKHDIAIKQLVTLLGKNPNNRYLNVNLGLLYKKEGNQLLAYRYLVKGAALLEQSESLYSLSAISKRADEYYESEHFNHALNLYRIVVNEMPSIHAWMNIGKINLQKGEYIEAIMAFHEVQAIDKNYEPAENKLREIHKIYGKKASDCYKNREYYEASEYYKKALELYRTPEMLVRIAKVYEKLNNQTKANEVLSEVDEIKDTEKEKEKEKQRLIYVEKGKALMKEKDFNGAIENFEKAFAIKPDKDVFMFLAHIYKGLKQNRRLSMLMRQWRLLMEREVRTKNS